MRFRRALLALFIVPVVVGLFLIARGAWVPDGAQCPGMMVDDESEERSGPMSEKDVCDVYSYRTNLSYGTRTRIQQLNYQDQQRGHYYKTGVLLTGYGLLGSAVVVAAAWPWRRELDAA
ncbi:hypothetical protein [Streptomyces mangrovisoli]|uniref:Uncharacterized protein n=1 Tax=Streptomyces mangrovisoli TaxID=1428628 RepID=A0A1J4NTX0_9ACTN|nr:hypothetical protein [Streptomyces mangrovisoli]OIJ64988.1 hypothetical protein WN71_026290 [Streptomyces mangrovisoli]